MDKSKSFLKVLTASTFIFFGWATLAVAGKSPKSGEYYISQDSLLTNSITVSEDRDKDGIRGYQKIPIQISQAQDLEQQSELTDIEPLEPNANPLTFPTQAEEVEINLNQPITLEQAVELAVRNNKDLQEAKLNLEQAEEQLREARAGLFPTLEAQLGVTNQDIQRVERDAQGRRIRDPEDPDTSLTSEELSSNITGSVTLNYEIYSGGEVSANIKRARRVLRSSELDLERITEQTRFEATRDYYNLQNANAQVEIAQAAIEESSQTLKDAQLLEQAGLRPQFDVLTAEVELANDQQTLARAIADQKTAQRTLAQTLSIGQQVELETADEIEEAGVWSLSLQETIVLSYRNRAELEQEIVLREANEQQRRIALAEIRPRVSLFAAYDYQVADIFDDFPDDEDENQYRFGAQLNWRLFDGGRAKARADQAETDAEINETRFANQRNTIRLEVESAYFSLEANQENIGTSQKALELAEESLRLARLRFQAGVGTQTEVIEAQSDLTTARGNLLTAVIEYNQSLNQLQRAVTNLPEGQLFDLP